MNTLSYRIEAMIRRPPEDVFDYCSDLRSELQWNPRVKYVEKLSDGPVGVGTRYRARWANSGPTTVEVVQFDRPRRWETTTRARGMSIRFRGTVTDAAQGARYTANLALHPRVWPGCWRRLPCWPCDARTSRTCTASGRRLSQARRQGRRHEQGVAAAAAAAGGYAILYRLGQTWGATGHEQRQALAGDELLQRPRR